MKCSKNVMIGLMVVIVVVLMVSLMFSPFMLRLEGFQEGNTPATAQTTAQTSACKQFTKKCSEANRTIIKEMNGKRDILIKNGDVNKDELKKPENQKYADVMKDTNCKEVFTRNCAI